MSATYLGTDLKFNQHTLKSHIHCIGRGYHSGQNVGMTIHPADADTGYVFNRRDISTGNSEVLARWYTASNANLSLTACNTAGVKVASIEHLIAALYMCGVDNAYITIDGSELPAFDGSAKHYVRLIKQAGLVELDVARRALVLNEPVRVVDGDHWAKFLPSSLPSVEMELEFNSAVIGTQKATMVLTEKKFENEFAEARLFGFAEQVEVLKGLGMALGGSIANSVLIEGNQVLNPEGLRFDNECVRHKCVEAIACLALTGGRVIGHYSAGNAGFRLNNMLVSSLMNQPNAFISMSLMEAADYWRNPRSPLRKRATELKLVDTGERG